MPIEAHHLLGRVIIEKYDPPLTRVAFEALQDIVKGADEGAEIAEVAFPSGKRILIVRYDRWPYTYNHVEPGGYLGRLLEEPRTVVAVREDEFYNWRPNG